jgi:hypothetical protein
MFQGAYNNRLSSDVIIKVGDRAIYAHKVILSCRSPVFKACFSLPMSENNSGFFEFHDYGYECIEAVIKWIYGFTINYTAAMYQELLEIARFLQMTTLTETLILCCPPDMPISNGLKIACLYNVDEIYKQIINRYFTCGASTYEFTRELCLLNHDEYEKFREKWIHLHPPFEESLLWFDCHYYYGKDVDNKIIDRIVRLIEKVYNNYGDLCSTFHFLLKSELIVDNPAIKNKIEELIAKDNIKKLAGQIASTQEKNKVSNTSSEF